MYDSEGFFVLLGFLFLFFFLAALILPWINRRRIRTLRKEINVLHQQMQGLFALLETHRISIPASLSTPVKAESWDEYYQSPAPVTPPISETGAIKPPEPVPPEPVLTARATEPSHPLDSAPAGGINFEQHFGAKLPVWIGGVALALAGFFLVKYSIETGLLSPAVRVVLGLALGIALLGAGDWIRSQPRFSNGPRIAQALSGAGIANLYFCLFAATSLYHLMPPFIGFAAMAGVTAAAVLLSLRHGMPIALLGLIGGFLTPAMVGSSDPNAPLLFIYLYFVFTGLMVVVRRQRWWILSLPAVAGALLWVLFWIFSGEMTPADTIWLGLFLLAVSGTVVMSSRDEEQSQGDPVKIFKLNSILNYLSLGGALVLMGLLASQSGFGLLEWGLFGLLAIGGVALAYFNQRLYGLVPWLSMAVNAVMLAGWHDYDAHFYALILGVFAAFYSTSGYALQAHSKRPLLWAGLTAAALIGYYMLGYFRLRDDLYFPGLPMFWGMLALGIAGFAVYASSRIMQLVPETHADKQRLLAIYASLATAFLSIAFTIELDREFLSVAMAAQLAAVAWISTRIDIRALRLIAGALAVVFGFVLLPQILLLVQLTVYSLTETRLYLQPRVPMVSWPLFQLGLPALLFLIASVFLRQGKDGRLVQALEGSAVALIGVMGYYLMRHAFHTDENVLFVKAGFFERGIITDAIFLYGIACLWAGRTHDRSAILYGGFALSAVAAFRSVYFDLILYNPLWALQDVGVLPVFNALLTSYGVPAACAWQVAQEMKRARFNHILLRGAYAFVLLMGFVYISMSVRQLFHGHYLSLPSASNAEIYSYSAAWLLFGLALLFFGTLRRDKMIRIASLVVMIVTVGKVFLYDASELTDLYRVFSFFGLGLSLLGLSWFYTRFVFTRGGDR